MSWLAVLLIGVAVSDLAHSVRPVRRVPEAVGATAAIVIGLCAGLTDVRDVVALVVIAVLVLAWGHTVTRGFGRGPAWLPLVVLAFSLVLAVGVSGSAPPVGGLVARWLEGVSVPVLADLTPERFLLLMGALGVQLSTGNVIVRLVLKTTGTINPAADGSLPPTPLKGGRLLGPLERVFIVSLGLAGHVTAASIVVAAKGLLRFPELSSRQEQQRVHQLTEYFLVGSFVSWLVALASLVLLA
ncbi:MAG: hypothetical protein LT071_04465 [Nocardioides sp.]|nr:hypothetical protein [Nocardioides sp.]